MTQYWKKKVLLPPQAKGEKFDGGTLLAITSVC